MPMLGEFHTQNGLTFRRNDDGSVSVRVYGNGADAAPTFEQSLSENTWASVLTETSWAATQKRPADGSTSPTSKTL